MLKQKKETSCHYSDNGGGSEEEMTEKKLDYTTVCSNVEQI